MNRTELDCEDWFDEDSLLTDEEAAIVSARLAAYARDPEAGSSWEEVETRILARLNLQQK